MRPLFLLLVLFAVAVTAAPITIPSTTTWSSTMSSPYRRLQPTQPHAMTTQQVDMVDMTQPITMPISTTMPIQQPLTTWPNVPLNYPNVDTNMPLTSYPLTYPLNPNVPLSYPGVNTNVPLSYPGLSYPISTIGYPSSSSSTLNPITYPTQTWTPMNTDADMDMTIHSSPYTYVTSAEEDVTLTPTQKVRDLYRRYQRIMTRARAGEATMEDVESLHAIKLELTRLYESASPELQAKLVEPMQVLNKHLDLVISKLKHSIQTGTKFELEKPSSFGTSSSTHFLTLLRLAPEFDVELDSIDYATQQFINPDIDLDRMRRRVRRDRRDIDRYGGRFGDRFGRDFQDRFDRRRDFGDRFVDRRGTRFGDRFGRDMDRGRFDDRFRRDADIDMDRSRLGFDPRFNSRLQPGVIDFVDDRIRF